MLSAPPAGAGDAPPLSWAQEVLALAERMRPGTVLDPRCVVRRAFAFPAEPDLDLLGRVLTEIVARHDALRTLPVAAGGEVRLAAREPRLVGVEVRSLPDGADEDTVRGAAVAAGCAPHDLEAGPLLRGTWLRRGAGGVLVLSVHHWAGDPGALDVLQRETAELYAALAHGRPGPAPPPRYADVAPRRGRAEPRPGEEDTLAWWRAQLTGARRAALPAAASHPPRGARGGASALVTTSLSPESHLALVQLSAEHRASPYMVLLAALGGVLDDPSDLLVFGVDAARARATRHLIGFLAEPVALRVRLDPAAPFGAAVRAAREAALGALQHRDVPFLRILETAPRLAVALLRGRRPATLVQYFSLTALELDGLCGAPLPTFHAAAGGEAQPSALPIDLDVTFERRGDVHDAAIFYDPALWSAERIEAALRTVEGVLRGAAADPRRSLRELAGDGGR